MLEVNELQGVLLNSKSYSWNLYLFSSFKGTEGKFIVKEIDFSESDCLRMAEIIIDNHVLELAKKLAVEAYPGTLDDRKELMLSLEDVSIQSSYIAFQEAVKNPVDQLPNKITGYILKGKSEEEQREIYLISKSNPYPDLKKKVVGLTKNNSLLRTKDLIQLSKKIDCVLFENELYAMDCKFEGIFHLEPSIKEKIREKIEELEETNRFTDESLALLEKSRNRKSICSYDMGILDSLKGDSEEMKVFSEYCNFGFNSQSQIELMDDAAADYFIKLLSGKVFFSEGKAYTNLVELEHKKDKLVDKEFQD